MSVNAKSQIAPQIQWHEGMLLSPHHFQQADLRHHQVLIHHMSLLSMHHWGIRHVRLDPIVLPDGLVRIVELEAVMPDGLIISYNIGVADTPPLEIDLKSHKNDLLQGGELLIQLALPERFEHSSPIVGDFPRYWSVEGKEVRDDTAPDNVVTIPRLVPRTFLHVGDNVPTRTTAIPLLKIAFRNEAFVQTPYIPPCFYVEHGTEIHQQCAELVQKIREKASYLSDRWQGQIGTPMAGETAAILRPLVEVLPTFETLIHGEPLNPYFLFTWLCQVAGQLSTLKLSQLPPVMPVYKHAQIRETIIPVLEHIHSVLATIEQSYATFMFNQRDRLFSLKMHRPYISEKIYIGVRIPRGMTEMQLNDWIGDAIIASDASVDAVRSKRITGAKRTVLREAELYELMPSRGVVIVEIQHDPEFIQADQNLNIFNPADQPERRPTEIVLYVKKGSGEAER